MRHRVLLRAACALAWLVGVTPLVYASPEIVCEEQPIAPPIIHELSIPTPAPDGVATQQGKWTQLVGIPGFESKPIYDPIRDRLLIVGGTLASGSATSAVWTLSLASPTGWSLLEVAGTPPPPRLRGVALYDSLRDRIVIFGGSTGSNSYAGDVWELTLSGTPTWNPIVPAGTGPLGREGASAVLDPSRDRIVIFGGLRYDPVLNPQGYFSDIWALSLASAEWTQLIPDSIGPAARWNHGAIYDAALDRMLIYGGSGAYPASLMSDLWSLPFTGDLAWTQLAPTGTLPAPRSGPAYAFDRPRNRLLMYGGAYAPSLTELWSLTLSAVPAWDSLAVTGSLPPYRSEPAFAYDTARGRVLLFGGGGNTATDPARADLWSLSLSPACAWTQVLPTELIIPARYATTPIFDPDRQRIVTFGGEYTYTFHHDYITVPYGDVTTLSSEAYPKAGVLSPTGAGPVARWDHSMVFDRARDRAVMFGGRGTYPALLNDVWLLDLATGTWTQPLIAGTPPPPLYGHNAVLDPLRDRMIVFGGDIRTYSPFVDSLTNQVWSLSLTAPMTWTLLTPTGTGPSPRAYASAVYDPGHDCVVFYGGREAFAYAGDSDTWALDLAGPTSWSQIAPLGVGPGARYMQAACYDSKRHRMLLFGGKSYPAGTESYNDTWALGLDGTPSWSSISTPAGAPASRYEPGAVYDSLRDEMVVLWGTSGYCAYSLLTDIWRLSFTDDATAVQVSLLRAGAAPGEVDLTWYSSGAGSASFTVYRREASTSWSALDEASAAGDGRIEYVDRTVSPGARYAYRLGQEGGSFSSETWVSVPDRFSLRLEPPRPNPGGGEFTIAFSLPNAARAMIELLDIAGRSVMTREVSGLGAGMHLVRLGERGYAPGIYLVRLRQGGSEITARAVVVK